MAKTAINPETGERIELVNGKWVPFTTATQKLEQKMAAKSFPEQMLIGLGRGMANVARQGGNILESILPSSMGVSDAELEGYRDLDRPLMDTTGGKVGSVAGEIAATAPLAGGIVGAGARGMGALMPTVRGAMAGTRAGQVGTGAGLGLSEGALEGALLSGPGSRAEGAAIGGTLGAAGGSLLPLITRGFRTPSESAKTVMDMTPSPDLTPGMMKPDGILNQLEQTAGSFPGGRTIMEKARETPQRQFAKAMINEGRPPGSPSIENMDVNSMLEETYSAFEPAYDQLKGFVFKNPAETVSNLATDFSDAAGSQVVAATKDLRESVSDFLSGQLTKLDGRVVDTDTLLDIRSDIRHASRLAAKSGDWKEAALFEKAEEAITSRINSELPEGFAEMNKAIDKQYAAHKIAERAVYKMGNNEYPTRSQWNAAIREATDQKTYAHGGGLLRDKAKAAADVFKATEPKTGSRVLTMAPLLGGAAALTTGGIDPVSASLIGGPLALLAATKGGRRFAVGETGLQKMMQKASESQPFMSTGVPSLPGMYLRSIAPVASSE